MTDTHLVSLTEVAYGNFYRYAARDLARQTVAKMNASEFLYKPATDRFVADHYFCRHSGNKIASSRTTQVDHYQYAFTVGQWRIDDLWGIYGRSVDMLCLLDPRRLCLFEGDYTNPKVNDEGRGDDARRYAEWMRDGLVAPAINVNELEDGRLGVCDGHRRVAAAKMAGVKLLAWVSFLMPNGRLDCNGRPMTTALTWEGARQGAQTAYNMWEERQRRMIEAAEAERIAALAQAS